MKNLLLGAIFMLMGNFAMADVNSYEDIKLKDVGTCTYTITTTVTLQNGYTYSYDTTYTTEANSLIHCIRIAKNHVNRLNQETFLN